MPASGRTYAGTSAAHRAADRKQRLLEAGLTVIGEMGSRGATVRAVCAEAGLTQRYFYEAFENTEDMLLQVYEAQLDRVDEVLLHTLADASGLSEKIDAGVRAYFELLREDPRLARVVLVEILGVSPHVDMAHRAGARRFVGRIAAIFRSELGEPDGIDLDVVVTGAVGALIFVATDWVLTDYERDLDEVVANVSFTLRAIGTGLIQRALLSS